MSMHSIPLSKMEEEGLLKHGLPVGVPSQLSDTFRQGIAWALQDPYIKSLIEDDQQAGITQAEEMNENMRLCGTIDKPKPAPAYAGQLDNCVHSWTKESPANGWRASCRHCGLKAQGSCQ